MAKHGMSAEVKTTLATGGTLLGVIVALAMFSQAEHREIREDLRHLSGSVDRSFDATDRRLDAMDRRLDSVESGLVNLAQRVGALDTRFSDFERRLLTLEGQMGRVLGALGIPADDVREGENPTLRSPDARPPGDAGETRTPLPGTGFALLASAPRPPAPGWTTGN